MTFIPEVPCHWRARGCAQSVPVTQLNEHLRTCSFHPSRTCRPLHACPEGTVGYERYILPAMESAGMLDVAEPFKEALCSSEALLPGFLDTLADGLAYDLAESLSPEDDWLPFRRALLQAQAAHHAEQARLGREEQLRAATRLCAWLLGSGDMEAAARSALSGLQSQATASAPGINFVDLPEESCLAIEAACLLQGRARAAEAIRGAPDDKSLPAAMHSDLVQVLMGLEVPATVRLRPLRPPPLPEQSVAAFRKKFEALRSEDDGSNQASRKLRLELRDYSWISREQVEALLAECEGHEYTWPRQPVPGYWTSGSELPGYLFSLVPLPESDLWRFQAAFDLTAVHVRTQDRKGTVPDRMVVQSVDRVENEKTWSEYVQRRSEIAHECRQGVDGAPDLKDIKLDRALFPGQRLHGDPGILGVENAQEHYFFHGTNQAGARSIAEQDFSTEFSSEWGLFGAGLYFAECATKSDEYCQEEGDEALCTMLVCRVCLGDHLLVDEDAVNPREVMQKVASTGRHSVLGDREAARGTFREFITYDSAACYTEYIVRYRRTFGPEAAEAAAAAREAARAKAAESATVPACVVVTPQKAAAIDEDEHGVNVVCCCTS